MSSRGSARRLFGAFFGRLHHEEHTTELGGKLVVSRFAACTSPCLVNAQKSVVAGSFDSCQKTGASRLSHANCS